MDKKEAVAYLESFESFRSKFSLEKITVLLESLENPEKSFESVKVAGTNGKGSTATFLHSILSASGIKTGLYISPHVLDYNERIQVNSRPISDADFGRIIGMIKTVLDEKKLESSFFEILTAAAFLYFREKGVRLAVLETGLGGRLDATNTASGAVSIITNIELDHTNILGSNFENIAKEKVQILSEGGTLITAEPKQNVLRVFREHCTEKNANLLVQKLSFNYRPLTQSIREQDFDFVLKDKAIKKLKIKMVGSHQFENASLAVTAALTLKQKGFPVDDESIRLGLLEAFIPGRFHAVRDSPLTILDSSHNPAGCMALSRALKQLVRGKNITLVFGCSEDKRYDQMLSILLPLANRAYFTRAKHRGTNPNDFIKYAKQCRPGLEMQPIGDVSTAVKTARDTIPSSSVLLVCGSLFVVGEALHAFGYAPQKPF